ncbi:ABC transporter permease [Bacillus gobiensis]|uniref:ABC transporter permease n=1 Tax=Bacillus gobiensis TaxID=1441095 RepID=UPI003D1E9366
MLQRYCLYPFLFSSTTRLTICHSHTLFFLFIYLLVIFIFYGIGFFLALFINSTRTAGLVSSGFFMALLFTSEIVLPLDSLPGYVQQIAIIFPMSHSIEIMQMLWIGQLNWNESGSNMIYLFVFSVVLLILLWRVKIRWDA